MTDQFRTLAVCGSMKPAPGSSTPSAARELLRLAIDDINRIRPTIATIDLREHSLPFFDGRQPSSHTHPEVVKLRDQVDHAERYIFSVPAYWGGIGGAFKNFIEVICGPNYGGGHASPFQGKRCAILLVGSEPETARSAANHMTHICESLGLAIHGTPIVIGNPKDRVDVAGKLKEFRVEIARLLLHQEQRTGGVEQ